MLCLFMMCINRTHVYVWFSRDRAYGFYVPFHKECSYSRFLYFFPPWTEALRAKTDLPLSFPVSLHASNTTCCIHLWKIVQARHARKTCISDLHAASFFNHYKHVRYVSKFPPAILPLSFSTVRTIVRLNRRSFDHWLPRERSCIDKKRNVSLRPFNKILRAFWNA